METMTLFKSKMNQFYKWAKLRLNYCLDRIIDLCDLVLMDTYHLPWSTGESVAKQIARYVGDISWLLRAFPRLPAYKLIGTDWTIIFVGTEASLKEIRALFFEEARQQVLGRIALWKLSAQTQQWLAEGTDLVVCELGRIYPNRPKAPITFTVPIWIQQVLTIPEPLESLIAGRKRNHLRHRINRAQKAGFNYRFSQTKADFDLFYFHMYLPFVKSRHGNLALITPYQDQYRRWFTKGGLMLVTHHGKPVAGSSCYIAGNTCYTVEAGILEADSHLFQQGVNIFRIWSLIVWGHRQGAKTFDMGGTHAWHSNGSFASKQGWGAMVARRKRIFGTWTFLARNLSPALQERINRAGFISEIDGKFYSVLLSTNPTSIAEARAEDELLTAKDQGLDGMAVISADSKPIIYDLAK
jgi:hypothetical protein